MEEHRIYSIKHGTWWKKKMPVNVNQNPIRITRRLFEDYKKKKTLYNLVNYIIFYLSKKARFQNLKHLSVLHNIHQ